MIKVLVNGAAGRMGQAMSQGILAEDDMRIVAAVDVRNLGVDIGSYAGKDPIGVLIEDDLQDAIIKSRPDVMLDFTNPASVKNNIRTALNEGVACVVGTTGLTPHDLEEIEQLSIIQNTPVFIGANFAITAVLMMQFAAEAAKYLPHFEIIERHHDNKLDAPSGTALHTLQMIAENREVFAQGAANEFEVIPGSRGGDYQGARVHSVRLPGYLASQEVVFGALGQTLTIRQDTINHNCFYPGVALALRRISQLKGVTVGLEQLM